MPKKPAIYYPSQKSVIPDFYHNAATKIDTTYGAKYTIDPALVAKLLVNDAAIRTALQEAELAKETAQAKTRAADLLLLSTRKELMDAFTVINNSSLLSEDDAEDLGMRVFSEEPDWDNLIPEIKGHNVKLDCVEFRYKKGPTDGLIMFSAGEAEVETENENTEVQTSGVQNADDASGLYINMLTEITRSNHSPIRDYRLNPTRRPQLRGYAFSYLLNDRPVGKISPIYKVVVDIYPR
ncbi:MAG: hypothetical protein KA792_06275 [Bacteroidales bacterium]|nr:hypothetical protein [Bacteroidales bacterium]